jgi:hypothetical protein
MFSKIKFPGLLPYRIEITGIIAVILKDTILMSRSVQENGSRCLRNLLDYLNESVSRMRR